MLGKMSENVSGRMSEWISDTRPENIKIVWIARSNMNQFAKQTHIMCLMFFWHSQSVSVLKLLLVFHDEFFFFF